jgi:hypothetical protein
LVIDDSVNPLLRRFDNPGPCRLAQDHDDLEVVVTRTACCKLGQIARQIIPLP